MMPDASTPKPATLGKPAPAKKSAPVKADAVQKKAAPTLSQMDALLKQIQDLRSQVAARPAEPTFIPPDPEAIAKLVNKHISRIHRRLAILEKNCGINVEPHILEEDEVHEEHREKPPLCASLDPIISGPPASRRRAPLVRKFEETPAV